MYRIYPVDQTTCTPFQGFPVMAMMKDGSRQIGILGRIDNSELILNDDGTSAEFEASSVKGKTARIRTRRRRKTRSVNKRTAAFTAGLSPEIDPELQEQASPWPGYRQSPFGSRAALPIDSIDYLFLLPV
ncbi:hypothetical protein [Paenibacillus sp. J2TS4]|uniref:hypothetical protein n=1 Tax=Paenibacillus sp. J2TS4 TaxID=2807194 RepID=UPI001B2DA5E9|nr:hypothetical protein [Paenibacillus sp. J2TS4]GIP31074.1 hypothetical protein J2TS4_02840 [Paenibacillus sp. J2TS4]